MTETKPRKSSNEAELTAVVIQLLAATLGKKAGKIKADTSLFTGENGFDSFGLMEFVLRLEDNFEIRIPDEHLDPDIFYSVQTIVNYLDQRLSERA